MIPAKKSLGQNFLKSQPALNDIIKAGDISDGDTVIEIGPGKGALTKRILHQAGFVIAIEKDSRLIPLLTEMFTDEIHVGKLEIREQDIMEVDPRDLPQEYKIIANIPYYITGALIEKFLSTDNQPSRMVLLLQKEVAERIAARDGKESILSLSVKAYGRPQYKGTVKAKYFSPQPKVDSAIILIETISKDFFSEFSEEHFFTIIKTGFAHKRKMLAGNLKQKFDKEIIEKAFQKAGVLKTARAEDVTLEQWKMICETI
jgi:16S rRNA (adenine1518-N6/adenine1519-N6)-dimethyltransferase